MADAFDDFLDRQRRRVRAVIQRHTEAVRDRKRAEEYDLTVTKAPGVSLGCHGRAHPDVRYWGKDDRG